MTMQISCNKDNLEWKNKGYKLEKLGVILFKLVKNLRDNGLS